MIDLLHVFNPWCGRLSEIPRCFGYATVPPLGLFFYNHYFIFSCHTTIPGTKIFIEGNLIRTYLPSRAYKPTSAPDEANVSQRSGEGKTRLHAGECKSQQGVHWVMRAISIYACSLVLGTYIPKKGRWNWCDFGMKSVVLRNFQANSCLLPRFQKCDTARSPKFTPISSTVTSQE